MEILIRYIIALVIQGLWSYYWYKTGYNKREKIFQTGTVTYIVGRENAMFVNNTEEGVCQVRVYNPKLVKFLK